MVNINKYLTVFDKKLFYGGPEHVCGGGDHGGGGH